MAVLVNDDELELLAGLPHSAVVLFLWLKSRMDVRTGLVGVKSRISWQAIAELVYVEPHQGRTEKAPGKETLRRLAGWLSRAGLIEQRGDKNAKTLVFLCKRASLISHVQNKPDTNPTDLPDTPEASTGKASEEIADSSETAKPDIHRLSIKTCVHTSSSSTSSTTVDDDDAHKCVETQKTESAETAQGETRGKAPEPAELSAVGQGIFWPPSLSQDQRIAIAAKLEGIPRAQVVVDELVGFMTRPGRPVDNPVRYVDYLIPKARMAVWVPEYAGRVRAARERAQAVELQRAAPPPPVSVAPPPPKNPEAARALSSIFRRKTA